MPVELAKVFGLFVGHIPGQGLGASFFDLVGEPVLNTGSEFLVYTEENSQK